MSTHQQILCPRCGHDRFHIIETRVTQAGRRRRRSCQACKYRETTVEIAKHEHQRLLVADRALKNVIQVVLKGKTKTSPVTAGQSCQDCQFYVNSVCEFEFPEAGDEFAEECSLYKVRS